MVHLLIKILAWHGAGTLSSPRQPQVVVDYRLTDWADIGGSLHVETDPETAAAIQADPRYAADVLETY